MPGNADTPGLVIGATLSRDPPGDALVLNDTRVIPAAISVVATLALTLVATTAIGIGRIALG